MNLPDPSRPPHEFDPHKDAGPVPSPCISICNMNARSGLCEGCWRTIEEIMLWSTANETEKRVVWKEIMARRDAGV